MERAEETVEQAASNGAGAVRSVLKRKAVVVPAALGGAGTLAATKGPELVRGLGDTVEEKGEETARRLGSEAASGARERLGVAGSLLAKALPGGGGGGKKKTRRLPIQRWTDVAVPVEQAYQAWTRFEDYPKFMHRVQSVEQKDENEVAWQEKVWFSTRRWQGRITERRENDRVVWKTTSGTSHKGIVSIHRLDDQLTRVMVELDFEPRGMIEKLGSGLRFAKRAVQADLARFKAYVEMQDAEGIDYEPGGDAEDEGADEDRASQRLERQSRRRERRERTGARGT
jgi:uncharacterized membrane protein